MRHGLRQFWLMPRRATSSSPMASPLHFHKRSKAHFHKCGTIRKVAISCRVRIDVGVLGGTPMGPPDSS
jgi:hypothetical protein